VLLEISKILAPFMPFIAEQIYKEIGGELESVHLESWTEKIESENKNESEHSDILKNMRMCRDVVTLALEERQKANIKVRQPLALLRIKNNLPSEYLEVIKDEINVKEVLVRETLDTEVALDIALTDELIAEGGMRDLVRSIQEKRKEAGLKPEDQITVTIPNSLSGLAAKYENEIKKAVNATKLTIDEELSITNGADNNN
jgi:isoleucyl-tRNA synthetase